MNNYERIKVIEYLQRVTVPGMRKNLCFGCSHVTLYDKNNKAYSIPRDYSLYKVEQIVKEIRKVNKT